MLAQVFILIVAAALLAASAGWDLASFTIPNFFPVALIAAFAAFVLASLMARTGMNLNVVWMHILAGFAGLSLGFALFAFGLIGGGDAKLLAAITLWLGFHDGILLSFSFDTALFGGVLAIGLIVLRQYPLPGFLLGQTWIMRLHNAKAGIPYGVALAAGTVIAVAFPVLSGPGNTDPQCTHNSAIFLSSVVCPLTSG
jgi:prepilin peptidase CpaA